MKVIINSNRFRELRAYMELIENENKREKSNHGIVVYMSNGKKQHVDNLAIIERKSKKQKLRDEMISFWSK